MGQYLIGAAVVIVGVVVWTLSETHARKRTAHLVAAISNGEQLSDVQRMTDTRQTLAVVIEQVAALRRALLVFSLVVIAAGSWAIWSIQDQANVSKHLVVDLRTTTCNFLRLQNTRVTEEIRQRQQRRDDTADEIIKLQATAAARPDRPTLEDVPGFNELPEAVARYASALAEAGAANAAANDQVNIDDARRRLGIYDEDLNRLRAEVDDVRNLAAVSNCPQATPPNTPSPVTT
jgi:hypothetical protein